MGDVTLEERVGRYQLLERLGEGAAAVVYKAYDPDIERVVAVKVLRESHCIDEEVGQRFLREARAAGNLSHPNIVTVFDVGEWRDRPYIVMELLPGDPLDRVMEAQPQFPVEQVIEYGIQLAHALDFAHRQGVVHRDIKPSNMILSPDRKTIKVTDFGIARMDTGVGDGRTRTGMIMGTPQYMAPEQVLGQHVDGRADLFSLGVVLYQLLSGQRAFDGETLGALFVQITSGEPRPLHELAPGLPGPLVAVVAKLLRKQADERYASGAELADALTQVRQASGQVQPTLVIPRRAQQRRPLRWAWIATAVLLPVAAVGLVAKYQDWRYGGGETPPEPPSSVAAPAATAVAPAAAPQTDSGPAAELAEVDAQRLALEARRRDEEQRLDELTARREAEEARLREAEQQRLAMSTPVVVNQGQAAEQAATATARTATRPGGAAQSPRAVVVFAERSVPQSVWHWAPAGVGSPQARVSEMLKARGYKVIDANLLLAQSNVEPGVRSPLGQLLRQAQALGVDVLVYGEAEIQGQGHVLNSPLRTFSGQLSVNMVDVKTGELIASGQGQSKVVENSQVAAMPELYASMLGQVDAQWQEQLGEP